MPITSGPCRRKFASTPWHIKEAAEALVGLGPTFPELLRGESFTSGLAEDDGVDLAGWLLEHHTDDGANHAGLRDQLGQLVTLPTPAAFRAAASVCRVAAAITHRSAQTFAAAAVLLDYFGAALGGRESAMRVAVEAIALADTPGMTDQQVLDNDIAALGWLAFAASSDEDGMSEAPRTSAANAAEKVWNRMVRAWRERLPKHDGRVKVLGHPGRRQPTTSPFADPYFEQPDDFGPCNDFDTDDKMPCGKGVVVLHEVGGTNTAEGGRISASFQSLVGASLPFLPAPDLASVRRRMLDSYPHAIMAIDAILGELVGRDHIQLPPVVLLGPPGSGKTRLAGELLDALGVPRMLYPCGGASDSSLGIKRHQEPIQGRH